MEANLAGAVAFDALQEPRADELLAPRKVGLDRLGDRAVERLEPAFDQLGRRWVQDERRTQWIESGGAFHEFAGMILLSSPT